MGRKTQLPPSQGNIRRKKQDPGPAAFFKHRKQALQQQQQLQKAATDTTSSLDGAPSTTISKGKARDTGILKEQSNQQLLSSLTSSSTSILDETSSSQPFSPYAHLSHSNIHGTNKDSSLRAYAHHLRSLVSQSDVLIQVLDARDPMGSRSAHTEKLLAAHPDKKLLLILTKIDLVPKVVLQKWLLYLRQFYPTLAFKSTTALSSSGRASRKIQTNVSASSSSLEASSSATLLQLLKNYARSQPKGMSLTVGIYGPPNVGKSSLINSLVKSRACSVAPRPGETKHLQTVLLDRKVRLIDSPGVAMSSARGVEDGIEDVLRGTVKIELVEDPAKPVAEILRRADPVKVTKLYKLPLLLSEEEQEHVDAEASRSVAAPHTGPRAIQEDDDVSPANLTRAPVDFASMRQSGREDDEEEEDDESEEEEDAFHRQGFEDVDTDQTEIAVATTVDTSNGLTSAIGYDPEDVTDFLLRLAFTKGKMLRGGKPDIEGAARMVINDWNLGRIDWYKTPPKEVNQKSTAASNSMSSDVNGGGGAQDEEMRPSQISAGADSIPQENEIRTSFSEAFDLEGLFAQADAQLFGGAKPAMKDTYLKEPSTTTRGVAHDRVLSAADVTSSSLGKRGRAVDDDDDDDSDDADGASNSHSDDADDDDEDPSDVEESSTNKRPSGFASTLDASKVVEGDEEMSNAMGGHQSKKKSHKQPDVLSTIASSTSSKSRIPAHLLLHHHHQQQQQLQTLATCPSPSSSTKRGNRTSKKPRAAHKSDPPAYLDRLEHKASLPTNLKKLHREGLEHLQESGVLLGRRSKGEERRKARKIRRREENRGAIGTVWKELDEVTLE